LTEHRVAIVKRSNRNRLIGMGFALPCALVVLIMTIYPLIQMVVFSFCKVKLPFFTLDFVEFKNFTGMVSAKTFGTILKNTLLWTFVSLVLRFVLGFISALLMDTGFRGKTPFRIIALMPWVVPSIVTANLWRWIYTTPTTAFSTASCPPSTRIWPPTGWGGSRARCSRSSSRMCGWASRSSC